MASLQQRSSIFIWLMLQIVGLQAAVPPPAEHSCSSFEFQCGDHTCIDRESSICNSVFDCLDGSDEAEKLCSSDSKDCAKYGFQCGDGSCILKNWQCDGFPDCFDSSDEQKCTAAGVLPEGPKLIAGQGGQRADKGDRLNTDLHDGSGNVYVDALLEEINEAVLKVIPNNTKITEFALAKLAEYDPDGEIECVLNGIQDGFQRKNDSWIRIEYKDLIFTAKIAIPPIDFKCNGKVYLGNVLDTVKQPEGISYWKKVSANTITPSFVVGLTTTGLVVDIKANMPLELCFKPKLEDLSVEGQVKPIIKIEGFWGQMASLAGWLGQDEIEDAIEGAKNSTIQAIQDKRENGPAEIKEMVNNREDIFCLDNSLDDLGDKLSSTLDKLLKEYNLN